MKVIGVNTQEAGGFRDFPIGLIHGGKDELTFQLADRFVICR